MNESTVADAPSHSESPALARRMGLFLLVAYGVGDMVGAGIYGTIGEAAAQMGNAVWLAFVGSMCAALFTGLSYASLASRYPRAAGAAYITQRAYRWAFLSYVVGLTVTASGMTSMATNSNVFAETLTGVLWDFFAETPTGMLWDFDTEWTQFLASRAVLLGFIGAMTFVNFWGIRESMWTNLLCTAVAVGGLIFVIVVGARFWGSVDYWQTPVPAGEVAVRGVDIWLVLSGSVLTFFSFVGFEDMLNVAEEVKEPERNMPWGIVLAVIIASALYIATSITVVSVVDYRELGDIRTYGAPISQVTDKAAPWLPRWVFEGVTMFAAANSMLINFIMGSRILYGMSRQGLLPSALGKVHPRRRTPHMAIGAVMLIVLLLALPGGIGQLASATALLLLTVFCLVNAALVVLKFRAGEAPGRFEVPVFVPVIGVLCCAGLIAARMRRMSLTVLEALADLPTEQWAAPLIAAGLIAFISALYFIRRPREISES